MLLNYLQYRQLFSLLCSENATNIFDVDEPMRVKLFLEFSIKKASKEILLYVDNISDEIFFSKEIFDILKNAGERNISLKLISNKTEERFKTVYSKNFNDFTVLENTEIKNFDDIKKLNTFYIVDNTSIFYMKEKFKDSFHGNGCFFDTIISQKLSDLFNIVLKENEVKFLKDIKNIELKKNYDDIRFF